MKALAALLAAVAAVAALPASAAAPADRKVEALERRVVTLRARVARLESQLEALASVNAAARRGSAALARLAATATACPITIANGRRPPGPTFGAVFHGNGDLWVGLWDGNVVVWEPEPDGAIDAKFGWWRSVPGDLRVEGRRLDASAPSLSAHVPDGYGTIGFQASGIRFPTPGCWEVTGRVGSASLRFVTLVVAA